LLLPTAVLWMWIYSKNKWDNCCITKSYSKFSYKK